MTKKPAARYLELADDAEDGEHWHRAFRLFAAVAASGSYSCHIYKSFWICARPQNLAVTSIAFVPRMVSVTTSPVSLS